VLLTHMQQILKRAGGGQPCKEQGHGVLLLTDAQNHGFTIGLKFQIQIWSSSRTLLIHL
jgi:hypothetical protein